MSNAVFPTYPGLSWNVIKTPMWSTKIQQATSGREVRAAMRTAPIYKIGLTYEILREAVAYAELQSILGFFNLRQGSFDSFLYTDPGDNAVVAESFGTGDGVTTAFQLTRSYGSNVEGVANINGTPTIYKNGVATVAFTISNGLVTFTVAPAAAVVLTWTGSYYYRVRFAADTIDLENFMYQLWQLKKLELIGSLGLKI